MIELRIPIDSATADALEVLFCEDYQEHWMLEENWKTHEQVLKGYFETREEAQSAFQGIRQSVPSLGLHPEFGELLDQDWKEAYKLHFKPWTDRGLHWVPLWEKETYQIPEGDEVVYLDPGMAFGTGNHETTRLCVRRLLDYREHLSGKVEGKSLIDAGCGSGILAISAAKIGFSEIYGFDLDPDSVRISKDNEALCELEPLIEWRWADLKEGLAGRQSDLVLANILAPILVEHARILLDAVKPGGELILSGILAREIDSVAEAFREAAGQDSGWSQKTDSRVDGDWADLRWVLAGR